MRLNKRDKLGIALMIAATVAMPAAALVMTGVTNIPAICVIVFASLGSAIYSATGRD